MKFHCPHFRAGMALTAFIAVLALQLVRLPGFGHLGILSIALVSGILARAVLHVPEQQHAGIGFSARELLRVGIVLIGVRLNFELLAHAGLRIFVLDASIVAGGLLLITWLGKRCGLPGSLALLLAVDSSICGASAAAAAASVIRAREKDIALVVPLCSLLGTAGVLALTAAQQFLHMAPSTFGVLAGATLHEIAQVMAAASVVPSALESGAITKLMRVTLLAPAVIILAAILARRRTAVPDAPGLRSLLGSLWFVLGFLCAGLGNTVLARFVPVTALESADAQILSIATFLMAMSMAGLGLQVDFRLLRENGLRTAGVAVAGWFAVVFLAVIEIRLMKL